MGSLDLLHKCQNGSRKYCNYAAETDFCKKSIIDFSKYPIGTQVVLRNLGADNNVDRDARTSVVMRFDVVRQESDDSSIPSKLRPVQPIPVSSFSGAN